MVRVRDYRKAAGLTQQELATICGIRADTLSKVENGRLPLSELLEQKIAHALNLSSYDRNLMLGLRKPDRPNIRPVR